MQWSLAEMLVSVADSFLIVAVQKPALDAHRDVNLGGDR